MFSPPDNWVCNDISNVFEHSEHEEGQFNLMVTESFFVGPPLSTLNLEVNSKDGLAHLPIHEPPESVHQ